MTLADDVGPTLELVFNKLGLSNSCLPNFPLGINKVF